MNTAIVRLRTASQFLKILVNWILIFVGNATILVEFQMRSKRLVQKNAVKIHKYIKYLVMISQRRMFESQCQLLISQNQMLESECQTLLTVCFLFSKLDSLISWKVHRNVNALMSIISASKNI